MGNWGYGLATWVPEANGCHGVRTRRRDRREHDAAHSGTEPHSHSCGGVRPSGIMTQTPMTAEGCRS